MFPSFTFSVQSFFQFSLFPSLLFFVSFSNVWECLCCIFLSFVFETLVISTVFREQTQTSNSFGVLLPKLQGFGLEGGGRFTTAHLSSLKRCRRQHETLARSKTNRSRILATFKIVLADLMTSIIIFRDAAHALKCTFCFLLSSPFWKPLHPFRIGSFCPRYTSVTCPARWSDFPRGVVGVRSKLASFLNLDQYTWSTLAWTFRSKLHLFPHLAEISPCGEIGFSFISPIWEWPEAGRSLK